MPQLDISLTDVLSYLKRFNLPQALNLIGVLNSHIPWDAGEKATANNPKNQPFADWINDNFDGVGERKSLQWNLARMARYLLLSQADDYKKAELKFGDGSFREAYHRVSQMHDPEAEFPLDELNDLDWWAFRTFQPQPPLQEHPGIWLSRAFLLFDKIPKQVGFYGELQKSTFAIAGLSPVDYTSKCFCLASVNQGIFKDQPKFGHPRLDALMVKGNVKEFLSSISCTKAEYIEIIRGTDLHRIDPETDIYNIEPLLAKPVIRFPSKIVGESDLYVCPISRYLLLKGSIGLFYLINDHLRCTQGKSASNAFRHEFGSKVLPTYVFKHLEQSTHSSSKIINFDSDDMFKDFKGKKPDFGILSAEGIILIEVKLTLLNVEARSLASPNQIADSCQKGKQLRDALDQLLEFEKYLQSGNCTLEVPKAVVKIIVCFDSLYFANSYIRREIGSNLGKNYIEGLQIATLTDIEHMGQTLFCDLDVVQRLVTKTNDPELIRHPITNYLYSIDGELNFDGCVSDKSKKEFLREIPGSDTFRFDIEKE